MKFYKTVVTVEVLTTEEVDLTDLDTLNYYITEGNGSGLIEQSYHVISKEQLIAECARHGTEPGFFLGYDEEEGE